MADEDEEDEISSMGSIEEQEDETAPSSKRKKALPPKTVSTNQTTATNDTKKEMDVVEPPSSAPDKESPVPEPQDAVMKELRNKTNQLEKERSTLKELKDTAFNFQTEYDKLQAEHQQTMKACKEEKDKLQKKIDVLEKSVSEKKLQAERARKDLKQAGRPVPVSRPNPSLESDIAICSPEFSKSMIELIEAKRVQLEAALHPFPSEKAPEKKDEQLEKAVQAVLRKARILETEVCRIEDRILDDAPPLSYICPYTDEDKERIVCFYVSQMKETIERELRNYESAYKEKDRERQDNEHGVDDTVVLSLCDLHLRLYDSLMEKYTLKQQKNDVDTRGGRRWIVVLKNGY